MIYRSVDGQCLQAIFCRLRIPSELDVAGTKVSERGSYPECMSDLSPDLQRTLVTVDGRGVVMNHVHCLTEMAVRPTLAEPTMDILGSCQTELVNSDPVCDVMMLSQVAVDCVGQLPTD